jgi:hypothetical protein
MIRTFEIIAKAAPEYKFTETLPSTSNNRILIGLVSGSPYTNLASSIAENYTGFITLNHLLPIFESLVLMGQSLFISYFPYCRSEARFSGRFDVT